MAKLLLDTDTTAVDTLIDANANVIANTAKNTNVTTDLSAGTRTATTIDVNSSDGTNATLVEADTTNAGILGSDKWDEIVANTSFTTTPSTVITAGTDLTWSGNTLDYTGTGGLAWNEVTTTTQQAAVDNGYITNNASLVTVTLPDTASLGSIVRIAGLGAGGWKLAQNASEYIYFGNTTTTTGIGGYLASTHSKDVIELVCVVANTGWSVISSIGGITVV